MYSEEKKLWAKILGENYRYRKGSRIRLRKAFRTSWEVIPRGTVFKVERDNGDTVKVWKDFEAHELPKRIIEPCPRNSIKRGDIVKVLKTIVCEGRCASGRAAYYFLKKGRLGRVRAVEPIGSFHKLIHVEFRGGHNAVYEDWEVVRVSKRGRNNKSVDSKQERILGIRR